MCECYQVGGPWIDYDPDCPIHGNDARRFREEAENEHYALESRVETLERQVALLREIINRLLQSDNA